MLNRRSTEGADLARQLVLRLRHGVSDPDSLLRALLHAIAADGTRIAPTDALVAFSREIQIEIEGGGE